MCNVFTKDLAKIEKYISCCFSYTCLCCLIYVWCLFIIQETCQLGCLILKQDILNFLSKVIQNKIEKLCKRFCKNAKVRLVFTSDTLCQTFSYKDTYLSECSQFKCCL